MTRRLALVIHAISGGGAERVIVEMAGHWARGDAEVTLVTLAGTEEDVYPVAPTVNRVGLDLTGDSHHALAAGTSNVRRIRALRRALREAHPDFVISFTDQVNVLTLLATFATGVPVIVCERTDPRHRPLGRAWSILRRMFYRRCFAGVVQTESVRSCLEPLCGSHPVYVIPNAVSGDGRLGSRPAERAAGPGAPRPRRIVSMGRLSPEKGFDLLVDAFASLAGRHPAWELAIFGEGPQRESLQEKIGRLDLGDRVRLPGWIDDRWAAFAKADIFALSSRFEGFPNALLEAMACGLPAVSFDCPSGPAEIVRHRVDGLLVEPGSVAALAKALHALMADDARRADYGARAAEVVDRFGSERFYDRWEAVFEGAATSDRRFAPPGAAEQA